MRVARRVVAGVGALLLVATGLPATTATAATTAPVAERAAASLGSATSYRLYPGRLRWNPCAKIHYRINLAGATTGALTDVKTAIARVETATGLDFVYDGRTTVIPQRGYGGGMFPGADAQPVVIAWAKPGRGEGRSTALDGGSELGVGMFQTFAWGEGDVFHAERIVTGAVVLDVASNRLAHGFTAGKATRGGLLLHELGHVVGLDHVRDTTQIMNPYIINRSTYGNGDKAGLAKVGIKAGCIK